MDRKVYGLAYAKYTDYIVDYALNRSYLLDSDMLEPGAMYMVEYSSLNEYSVKWIVRGPSVIVRFEDIEDEVFIPEYDILVRGRLKNIREYGGFIKLPKDLLACAKNNIVWLGKFNDKFAVSSAEQEEREDRGLQSNKMSVTKFVTNSGRVVELNNTGINEIQFTLSNGLPSSGLLKDQCDMYYGPSISVDKDSTSECDFDVMREVSDISKYLDKAADMSQLVYYNKDSNGNVNTLLFPSFEPSDDFEIEEDSGWLLVIRGKISRVVGLSKCVSKEIKQDKKESVVVSCKSFEYTVLLLESEEAKNLVLTIPELQRNCLVWPYDENGIPVYTSKERITGGLDVQGNRIKRRVLDSPEESLKQELKLYTTSADDYKKLHEAVEKAKELLPPSERDVSLLELLRILVRGNL